MTADEHLDQGRDAHLPAKLVVGITSLPSRVGEIRPCLDSLLAGSLRPDKIFLILPKFSVREQSGYDVPAFLERPEFCQSIVDIVRTDRDWGPGTKLLGTLDRLPEPCVLVLADDDVIYHPTFLADLYAAQVEDTRSSFSFHTYRSNGLTIGQGCDGFSFWSPNLDGIAAFAERHVVGTNLFFHDDLWISFFLKIHGIAVRSLADRLAGGLVYERMHDINSLNRLEGPLKRRQLDRDGTNRLLKEVPMPSGLRLRLQCERMLDRIVGSRVRKLRRKLVLWFGRPVS